MASIPIRQRVRSAVGAVVRRGLVRARDRFLKKARWHCDQTQRDTLRRLLTLNADSEFSIQHGLDSQMTAEQFRQQFPVCGFEAFRDSIEKMVAGNHRALLGSRNRLLMFALTSGTTARAKHIPITREFVKDYRRGWQHWGISVHERHPELKLLKMVQLISCHEASLTADGTPCGNISGLVTAMQSRIIRKLYSIPACIANVEDPTSRRLIAARFAIQDPWVGMFVTANPSSLIGLLNTADENADKIIRDISDGRVSCVDLPARLCCKLNSLVQPNPKRAKVLETIFESYSAFRAKEVWPDCCVLGVWTGGSVSAYLPELKRRFGDLPVRDHGLHASEGRMTIPIHDDSAAGLLDIESHYFEFVPESELMCSEPSTLAAHEIAEGQLYGILLTTSSGLYRYNICDIVRCTGFYGSTPMLEFLHKGAHISSITGEKITESQVVAAVKESLTQVELSDEASLVFTMTPVWGEPPGYQLCITANANERRVKAFERAVDENLCRGNCEYEDKRASGRLRPVRCRLLTADEWQRFADHRLSRAGGSLEQYKHPFLLPDPKFENRFDEAIAIK